MPSSATRSPGRRARHGGARYCYVHVGTHKTGTTSLQCFLTGNRERFAEHGVVFPRAGCDEDATVAHHQLARELMGLPQFDPARGGLAAVASELRTTTAGTACLSSELFSFLFDAPQALTRLRDAIAASGFTPRIVVYLRPQASYGAALYAENVRQGYRLPFAAYFADLLEHGSYIWNGRRGPPLDYLTLLDGFAAVFGREAVIARRYRGHPSGAPLFASFVRVLLPHRPRPQAFDIPRRLHNGSLRFHEILRSFGCALETHAELRFAPLTLLQLLRLCGRFMRSNIALALRYHVAVPVFERDDLALATPLGLHSHARAAGRAREALRAAGGAARERPTPG